ncbi:hypothetical protein OHV05_36880 (plasmid) [Kitasatospora sp. NBC_00070]|uniref:hypothetical protein n=1 Tax=Kitasatospora sp. NBC_00070 TaxID=2975962 RepID=UPI002F909EA5
MNTSTPAPRRSAPDTTLRRDLREAAVGRARRLGRRSLTADPRVFADIGPDNRITAIHVPNVDRALHRALVQCQLATGRRARLLAGLR